MKEGNRKNVLTAARMAHLVRIPQAIATAVRYVREKAQQAMAAVKMIMGERKKRPRPQLLSRGQC